MEFTTNHFNNAFHLFESHVAQKAAQRKSMEYAIVALLTGSELKPYLTHSVLVPTHLDVADLVSTSTHANNLGPSPVLSDGSTLHHISTKGLHTSNGLTGFHKFSDEDILTAGQYLQRYYTASYYAANPLTKI